MPVPVCVGTAALVMAASSHAPYVLFSDPFQVTYPCQGSLQLLLPVAPCTAPSHEEDLAEAQSYFNDTFANPPALATTAGGSSGSRSKLLLLRVSRPVRDGCQEVMAAVLQVQLLLRKSGCLHIVLQSLGGEPQHLLQNCTGHPVRYRQRGTGEDWSPLVAYTAAGLVRRPMPIGQPPELELCDAARDATPAPETLSLGTSDAAGLASDLSEVDMPSLSPSSSPKAAAGAALGEGSRAKVNQLVRLAVDRNRTEVLAHALDAVEQVLTPSGVANLQGKLGTSLGAMQLDKVLRVVPKPSQLVLLQHSTAAEQLVSSSGSSGFHIALELGSLDVSVVDHRPREVLLLSVDGLWLEYGLGDSAGMPYSVVHVRVNNVQVGGGTATGPVLLPGLLDCSAMYACHVLGAACTHWYRAACCLPA